MKSLIIFTIAILILTSSSIKADVKKDCSKFTNDTLLGTYDKWRCKQGKEERKKLNIKTKIKNIIEKQ